MIKLPDLATPCDLAEFSQPKSLGELPSPTIRLYTTKSVHDWILPSISHMHYCLLTFEYAFWHAGSVIAITYGFYH